MTVDEVNKRFAIVAVGNKMVVMENNPDGSIHELWAYEDFKKKLIKYGVKIKSQSRGQETTKIIPLADYWLKSATGRHYNRLVYSMPGSIVEAAEDDYNGWQGFSVKSKRGDWSLNKAHIKLIICAGNEEYFQWVLNWMAALVQLPGRHASTSIVLRGGQGVGKGFFANNMIGGLFGSQQYLHILGANQLTAEFNEHLSGKVYIFADESTWGGDPKAAAKLKGLVTEDTIPIHRKFLKMVEEPSMLHIVISSNNEWPIPIEHDDRRFTVFDVLETQRQNHQYFSKMHAELKAGGLSAMLYDLQEYDVDQKMLRTPLLTDAKSDITAQSLRHIEHWWLEILESGIIQNDTWPLSITKRELHQNYLDFLERHHRSSRERRSTETELGIFLRKFTPLTQQTTVNGKIERVIYIPELHTCRDKWVLSFNWPNNYVWDKYSQPETATSDPPETASKPPFIKTPVFDNKILTPEKDETPF